MKSLFTFDLAHLKDFIDFYSFSHNILLIGSSKCPFFLCYDELLNLFNFSGVSDFRILGYEIFIGDVNKKILFYLDDSDMETLVELYLFGGLYGN